MNSVHEPGSRTMSKNLTQEKYRVKPGKKQAECTECTARWPSNTPGRAPLPRRAHPCRAVRAPAAPCAPLPRRARPCRAARPPASRAPSASVPARPTPRAPQRLAPTPVSCACRAPWAPSAPQRLLPAHLLAVSWPCNVLYRNTAPALGLLLSHDTL